MIHELDAVVAHLYGLNEAQLVHIFETFHEGWDYHAAARGRAGPLPCMESALIWTSPQG